VNLPAIRKPGKVTFVGCDPRFCMGSHGGNARHGLARNHGGNERIHQTVDSILSILRMQELHGYFGAVRGQIREANLVC
jgi:hypothetical protein